MVYLYIFYSKLFDFLRGWVISTHTVCRICYMFSIPYAWLLAAYSYYNVIGNVGKHLACDLYNMLIIRVTK